MDAQVWEQAVADWLTTKAGRSHSEHTRRSYAAAMAQWRAFLGGTPLWEVDPSHVRAWQQSLRAQGLSEATINHKLSCVSSFYAWAIEETRLVGGVEVRLFVDAAGKARANPFRAGNVPRGRTLSYQRAQHLSRVEVATLLGSLEANAGSLAGARAHALILTYLYTGWRSAELLRMRWGDIRPSRSKADQYIYAWQGKGNKRQDDVLPGLCYRAICAYLRKDGRLGTGRTPAQDEPVWLPVSSPRMEGLRGEPSLAGQPINDKTALRILRLALRAAGIAHGDRFRIHDLRHTHAHLLLETGATIATVQQRLHHSSLATTGLYVRAAHGQEPEDVVSDAFAQLRLRTESAPD